MSANKEIIESIRNTFLSISRENSDKFHPLDVDRVRTDDWPIERFVLVNKSEESALKALVKTMEWRKSFGVNDFNDQYFPQEMYKIGEFSTFCKDKEGRPIVWFRLNRHYKSSEFGLLVRQYLVYNFEKCDRQTRNQGWATLTDASGAGISNVDMDFSNFMVEVLQNHYPRGVKFMVITELPWILNATSKAIVAFMNPELKSCVKFHKKDELTQYMDRKCIPIHLNGSFDKDLIVVPVGAKPLEELTHTKLTAEQIKKIRSTFKEWLK